MEFKGKKLEDIVVTLPFGDGTSMDCGVYSYFEVYHLGDRFYWKFYPSEKMFVSMHLLRAYL